MIDEDGKLGGWGKGWGVETGQCRARGRDAGGHGRQSVVEKRHIRLAALEKRGAVICVEEDSKRR